MRRIIEKCELFSDRSDEVCPRVKLLLEANKVESRRCNVAHSGDYKFEVTLSGNRFVVDLNAGACTCRYFDVRGIPCSHVVACIHWVRQDPANFSPISSRKMHTNVLTGAVSPQWMGRIFGLQLKWATYSPLSWGDNPTGPSKKEELTVVRDILPIQVYPEKACRWRALSATRLATIRRHAPKDGWKMEAKYGLTFFQTFSVCSNSLLEHKGLNMYPLITQRSQGAIEFPLRRVDVAHQTGGIAIANHCSDGSSNTTTPTPRFFSFTGLLNRYSFNP